MKPKFYDILIILTFLYSLAAFDALAQRALQAEELDRYRQDTESLVAFLEFTFNTIGSNEIPVREKDIIINQSFSKFFENEKVQIEDDLDENREVPINKDVQAYLKDIDFFFREVEFTFSIQDIEHQINDRNQIFFKITLNRNLSGVTVAGDTVNSNRLRYIEINLDDEAKDLKIASIYTTKLNEKEELRKWWNELPQVWKNVFGESIVLHDTVRLSDVVWFNDSLAKLNCLIKWRMSRDTLTFIAQDSLYLNLNDSLHISAGFIHKQLKRITSLDTLDVSGNSGIVSLEPVSRLSDLRRINCSHTLIADLMPLRNLSKLEYLDCSHTAVASLSSLKYSTSLKAVDISYTLVSDISPAMNFTALESFYLNHTPVDSLTALSSLTQLKDLEIADTKVSKLTSLQEAKSIERIDISGTQISDLSPLSGLTAIYLIKFENTPVSNLAPLKNLEKLIYIFADHSRITDLSPLDGLHSLNRVYCDKTGVTRREALSFMQDNIHVLVIYESADLEAWWDGLTPAWKRVFTQTAGLTGNPAKEELHQIIRIRQVNIAGNQQIQDLEPLSNLPNLTELNAHRSGISSLEPLNGLADLREINFSETGVMSVAPLGNLPKLEKILMDNTLVTTLQPLSNRQSLRYIYCDMTPVSQQEVLNIMDMLTQCLIIYQTGLLQTWWADLPDIWKSLADDFVVTGQEPGREQLQQFVNMRNLDLNNIPGSDGSSIEFKDLDNIKKFLLLEELRFTNTSITNLKPLRGMSTLKTLICPNNPIETLEPLSEVRNLQTLDVQSTPVRNLEFLAGLTNLKRLNISGTLIRNLKGLEYLENIEQLNAYNTSIRRLDELESLSELKLVRVYNTRISLRRIEKFREKRPDVEVVFY
jgi:Leucine-rich repeat (LRR) protein